MGQSFSINDTGANSRTMLMRLADDVKLRNKISTEEDWNVLQEDEGRELQAGDG